MKLYIKDYDFLIFYKTWSNLMFICGGWKGNRFKCQPSEVSVHHYISVVVQIRFDIPKVNRNENQMSEKQFNSFQLNGLQNCIYECPKLTLLATTFQLDRVELSYLLKDTREDSSTLYEQVTDQIHHIRLYQV